MASDGSTVQDGNAVTTWFGEGFGLLHPLLQDLHRRDGTLRGPVTLWFGPGSAGAMGRRLARHLGIPDTSGEHAFEVEIGHDATGMWWNRRFDGSQKLHSRFRLTGCWPDGQWIEATDPLEMNLTVSVIDGGWYWRIVSARLRGVPMPLALLPRVTAYKRIEDGKYRFHVGFGLPLVGEVFSYSGLLEADPHG
jgi:hypothetical protein